MTLAEPGHLGDVTIEEVDLANVTEADIDTWLAYDRLMSAESPPLPFEPGRPRIRSLPAFMPLRLFVARDADGALAGDGRAMTVRTENNRDVCQAHVSVRSDRRRRGIGTALLRLILGVAESEGRSLVVGWSSDRAPAGAAFASRLGAEAALQMQVTRLRLADVDHALLERWIADASVRAKDYRLVAVDGPYPEDQIDAIVDLRLVMKTAPHDALRMETPILTVDQMREADRIHDGMHERWALFARHEPTGELVGFTEVGHHRAVPETVFQAGTAVRTAHRGHGLGKWLKATMLQRIVAQRPGVEDVRTGNAVSNAAMLDINQALGFRPWIHATAWQAPAEALRTQLGPGSR